MTILSNSKLNILIKFMKIYQFILKIISIKFHKLIYPFSHLNGDIMRN